MEVLLIYTWSKQATGIVLTVPKPTLLIVINIPEGEHRGGAEISASAESMTALLCPGNDPGLPFIFSLQSVGLGNSISCLEQISKR